MQTKLILAFAAMLLPFLQAAPLRVAEGLRIQLYYSLMSLENSNTAVDVATRGEDLTMALYEHDKAKRAEEASMALYEHDKAKRGEDASMALYEHDKAKRAEDVAMRLYESVIICSFMTHI